MSNNFDIIYKKLEDAKKSSQLTDDVFVDGNKTSLSEMDEIDELRKMVLEISDPESYTYTSS